MYWPDPMVQYVSLTRLTYDRGQNSWHSSHGAFRLFTVPGLILGLFDRPHWLCPPWTTLNTNTLNIILILSFTQLFGSQLTVFNIKMFHGHKEKCSKFVFFCDPPPHCNPLLEGKYFFRTKLIFPVSFPVNGK